MFDKYKTRQALRTRKPSAVSTERCLRLTIVFHPELERVGAFVDIAPWLDNNLGLLGRIKTIGRNDPEFSDGAPLREPHVSRLALEICRTATGVNSLLRVKAGEHSDCRVGEEEWDEVVLDLEKLVAGVPIRFGHAVVVLLRLVKPFENGLIETDVEMIGVSVEMQRLRLHLNAAAKTELPVLILGESGVGKEVAANTIHRGSRRANQPMVAINMAAISETLAQAELFGSVRGAFTGAQERAGYFQQANSGTLFLDEIGDTPGAIQVQLLRALEQGEIQVVGGKPTFVDVRIIAATDASVSASDGFRHALHTRLSGHTICIPPLRKRREDIGPPGH